MMENSSEPILVDFYSPPSWDELFIRKTYLIASKSKDYRTKIGAILVKDNHQIAEGYNGLCKGVLDLPHRIGDRANKYIWVEHAERNCCFMAAKLGISTVGSVLYCQGLPCVDCARALIQSGVKEVCFHKEFQDIVLTMTSPWVNLLEYSILMFKETKVKVRAFSGNLGVKAFVDGKIITL